MSKSLIFTLLCLVFFGCNSEVKVSFEAEDSKVVPAQSTPKETIDFSILEEVKAPIKSNDYFTTGDNSLISTSASSISIKENTATAPESYSFDGAKINYTFYDNLVSPSGIYNLTDDGAFISLSRATTPVFTQYLSSSNLISGNKSTNFLFLGSDTGLYRAANGPSLGGKHGDLNTQRINAVHVNSATAPDHILVAADDGLYISSDEGVNFSRHSDVDFENITTISQYGTQTYLAAGDTGVYVSNDTGVNWTKSGTGTMVANQTIKDVAIGADGKIVVATSIGLAVSLNGGVSYVEYKPNNSDLSSKNINDVEIDKLGNIYVATDKGLNILRDGETDFVVEDSSRSLPSNNINSIRIIYDEVENPNIYLATDNGAVTIENAMPATPSSDLFAKALSSSSAELTWTSSGGTTHGYKLAYKISATPPLNCVDPSATSVEVGNMEKYTLTGLTHLSTYGLRLCPVNQLGVTSHTNSVATTVAIPENLAPLPTLGVVATSMTYLTVGWTSTGGTTNSWVLKYLQGGTPPTNCTGGTSYPLGTTVETVSGVPFFTQYSFRLCAVNTTGFLNDGTTLTLTTDQAPPNMANLDSITNVLQTSVQFNFTNGGGTTSKIEIVYKLGTSSPTNCDDGTKVNVGLGGTHTLTSLQSNRDYAFRICAYNSTNNVVAGNFITVKTDSYTPTDITLSNNSLTENDAINTVVGTLTPTDQDDNVTYVYTLVAGSGDGDNAKFNISGNNLRSSQIFDHEVQQTFDIRLRVTDSSGKFFEKAFSISLFNVNDRAPVLITPTASLNLAENSMMAPINVNDITGGDTDIESDQIYYSCYYDTNINGSVSNTNACSDLGVGILNSTNTTGVITWTPSFTQEGQYEFKIIGDDGVFSDFHLIAIDVTHTNAPPHDIALSSANVTENVIAGFNVGTITASDVDPLDTTFTYSLVSGTGDTNNADFTIISNSILQTLVAFDHEQGSTRSIRLRATDPQGEHYDEVHTITINNLNDVVPIIATLTSYVGAEDSFYSMMMYENNGTILDPDGNTLYYSCFYDQNIDGSVSETNACSDIGIAVQNGTTTNGVFAWTPSYTQEGSYEFKIKVSDTVFGDDEIFDMVVNHTNAPPTDLTITSSSILENQVTGYGVGYLTPTDVDTVNTSPTYSYSLVNGIGDMDNAGFVIIGNHLQSAIMFDRESKSSHSIRVRVTDQGGKYFEKVLTISIDNVNETPELEGFPASNPHTFSEGEYYQFDCRDTNSGGDTDVDGDSIFYTCYYDQVVDGVVALSSTCSSIGISVNASNGVIGWTPNYTQAGNYELRIIGDDLKGFRDDDNIFSYTIVEGCTGTIYGNVPSGYSAPAYSTTTPTGTCASVSETRTCTLGTIDGSFPNPNCFEGCLGTPWGTLSHGQSRTGYSSSTPPGPCTSFDQTRTCNDGTLSGSYSNTSCTNGCLSEGISWSSGNCTGTTGNMSHGENKSINDTATWYTGTRNLSCNNGTISKSGGSCVRDLPVINSVVHDVGSSWTFDADGSTFGVRASLNAPNADSCTWCGVSVPCDGSAGPLNNNSTNPDGTIHSYCVCEATATNTSGTVTRKGWGEYTCQSGNRVRGSSRGFSGLPTTSLGCSATTIDCYVDCPAQTINWGSCSANIPYTTDGSASTVNDDTAGYTGTRDISCSNGVLSHSGGTCTQDIQYYKCPNISAPGGHGGVCSSSCNGQTTTASTCKTRVQFRATCNGSWTTRNCTKL